MCECGRGWKGGGWMLGVGSWEWVCVCGGVGWVCLACKCKPLLGAAKRVSALKGFQFSPRSKKRNRRSSASFEIRNRPLESIIPEDELSPPLPTNAFNLETFTAMCTMRFGAWPTSTRILLISGPSSISLQCFPHWEKVNNSVNE